MGKCIACGAETPSTYKICIPCSDLAHHSPCMNCKAENGRKSGCQDHCDRRAKWLTCHRALMKLENDRRRMLRNRKFYHY